MVHPIKSHEEKPTWETPRLVVLGSVTEVVAHKRRSSTVTSNSPNDDKDEDP